MCIQPNAVTQLATQLVALKEKLKKKKKNRVNNWGQAVGPTLTGIKRKSLKITP